MLPDYLVIGGVEIINTVRADAYGALLSACGFAAGCLDCPGILDVINNGEPYDDPTGAPWYDATIPESAGVYGYTGLTVTGLDAMVWPDPGDADESPQGTVRDFEFEVLISTGDACAMSYAIGWLASALADPACGSGGCAGQAACMLACCPDTPEQDVIRTVYGVRTVDGPRITRQVNAPGRVMAIATFTLRTPYPQIYREPISWTVTPFTGTPVDVDLVATYENCPDPVPCTSDPDCARPPMPGIPVPPMDPCYPAQFTGRRTLLSIPRGAIPSGLDASMVVTVVTPDAQALRNLVVRIHNNPFGVPCDRLPELNPCRACTDMVVGYIPGNGGLIIDGRTQTETVHCGSGQSASTGVPVVYGSPGSPFHHPVWACSGATCIEIITDAVVSPRAEITISLVPRQEAG